MTNKERPILFSGPMARALLDGKKTQTRRIVKPQRHPYGHMLTADEVAIEHFGRTCAAKYPCGQPGDRPWVRETWGIFRDSGFRRTSLAGYHALPEGWHLAYRADHVDPVNGDGPHTPFWRPSIHMPRWASRITLEITDVRVQRLQDITEADAQAEGAEKGFTGQEVIDRAAGWPRLLSYRSGFINLWESIHGPGSWDVNPWVWAISFQRVLP